EVLTGDLAQVLVDVLRADGPRLTVLVQVLEQLLPRQVLAAPHDAGQPRVRYLHVIDLAALAAEPEANSRRADLRVPVTERSKAERAIIACVLRIADPDEALLEQPHHCCQHPLARQA